MNKINYRQELIDKGYFLYKGLLSKDEVKIIKERLRYVAQNADYYSKHGIQFIVEPSAADQKDIDPLKRYYKIGAIGYRDQFLWNRIPTHPKMIHLATEVLGPDVCVNVGGGFFLKPPLHGSITPWHQDSAVWGLPPTPYVKSDTPLLFDYWMAIDPATKENGCLQLIPGSHELGRLPHHKKADSVALSEVDISQYGYTAESGVPFEMEPGDILVWHPDLLHYSGPNRSANQRIGTVGTFIAKEAVPWMRTLMPNSNLLEKAPISINGKPAPQAPNPIPDPKEAVSV
jgi:phytanoyl-CoA hydroxylase